MERLSRTPKIVLANALSRAMVADQTDIPIASRPAYDAIARRLLWSLEPGDVFVAPHAIDADLVAYVQQVLGWSEAARVVTLDGENGEGDLSWYPLHNPNAVAAVRRHIAESGTPVEDWSLDAYIMDRDTAHWSQELGLTGDVASASGDLASHVNSKVVFRLLAAQAGVPVPAGAVVDPNEEASAVVARLLPVTGSVIVKQDRNAGGDGNTVITTDPHLTARGAIRQLTVSPASTAAGLGDVLRAAGVVPDETSWGRRSERLVVEAYHPGARTYSTEVVVGDGTAVLMNAGKMRMEPVWCGYEFPVPDLDDLLHRQLVDHSIALGSSASALGFRGLMNIDAVVTLSGELVFTEFNGRKGGATGPDTIARKLLGDSYVTSSRMLTQNGQPVDTLAEALGRLHEQGLHFDPATGCGAVVANYEPIDQTVEYVVFARLDDDPEPIEARVRAALSDVPDRSTQVSP